MRITRIYLENIRCFEKLDIDLSTSDGGKKWMVVLGENGVGKTTLLRCIALGLCEKTGAAGLCSEITGDWIRSGAEKGVIRIELLPYSGYEGEQPFVETILKKADYDEMELLQETKPRYPDSFRWEDLFVCGYGSARSVYGSMDVSEYSVTDSVYSLFNYDTDLQNPELCLRRLQKEGYDIDKLLQRLENVLMIEEGSVTLKKSGIMVDGPWGKPMLIGAIGDGYKSTITWLLDLFGWRLLAKESDNFELEGIVILDELEKHLHPKWQKQLIGLLSTQFPNIQFIVSTHSPLCVIGTTELTDEDCCMSVLRQEQDKIITYSAKPPRGKRADQVLTSYLFELYTTGDEKVKNEIGRYQLLYNNPRKSKAEQAELDTLFESLSNSLGSAESELETKISNVIEHSLKSLFNDKVESMAKNSPEKFELIRQLKDLL